MSRTALRVLPSPHAVGEEIADRVLERIERARLAGSAFLFGSPTGRTPRPFLAALARRLAERPAGYDLSHVTLVMMDEYLVSQNGSLARATGDLPWSCRHFARTEILDSLNASLPPGRRLREESVWFPDPGNPGAYDRQIADAGGVDYFLLASGAGDGHVAFNQPGTPRESLTRVVELSEPTRRDNLATSPSFGTLDGGPRHGVTVGIATLAAAKEAVMVAWGSGKQLTVDRMMRADRYDPSWPATVIHACPGGEIVADAAAASGMPTARG